MSNVTTIRGTQVPRENTRRIQGNYYEIDVDVVKIGDTWYRTANSDKITFDHKLGKYVLISENRNMIYGWITSTQKGYFTQNVYENVPTSDGSFAISREVLGEDWVENYNTGVFYKKSNLTSSELLAFKKVMGNPGYYQNFGYNVEDNENEFRTKIKYFKEFVGFSDSVNLSKFAKFLKGATFGAEIEFSKGIYTDILRNRCGLVLCRDGSTTSGGEAVTVPLSGAKGVGALREIGDFSKNRILTDHSCSYHLHWGNCVKSNKHLIAIYRLCELIQHEIFTMFPYYKTNWRNIKRQNYNQLLESKFPTFENVTDGNIDRAMGNLFHWLSGERLDGKKYKDGLDHPQRNKWDRKSRYFWVNFMNMFFGSRKTIEFRLHHNTTNPYKLVNWLYITRAIILFAEIHSDKILKKEQNSSISLTEVLNIYRDMDASDPDSIFLSEYLNAYVKERKKFFLECFKKGDVRCDHETNQDKNYTFDYKGKNLL